MNVWKGKLASVSLINILKLNKEQKRAAISLQISFGSLASFSFFYLKYCSKLRYAH